MNRLERIQRFVEGRLGIARHTSVGPEYAEACSGKGSFGCPRLGSQAIHPRSSSLCGRCPLRGWAGERYWACRRDDQFHDRQRAARPYHYQWEPQEAHREGEWHERAGSQPVDQTIPVGQEDDEGAVHRQRAPPTGAEDTIILRTSFGKSVMTSLPIYLMTCLPNYRAAICKS